MKDFLRGEIGAASVVITHALKTVNTEGVRHFTPDQQRKIEAALFCAAAECLKAIHATNPASADASVDTNTHGGANAQHA
jgi:hypothetical protein